MPYSIKDLEKKTVELHVRDTIKDMYEFDSVLNPEQLEVFTMDIAGVPVRQIAKRLDISVTTVNTRLNKAKRAVALAKPESPIAQGRAGVQGLIPKSVKVYDKALKGYAKRPGLAVKAAGEILKGTQVLIPKEIQESSKETVETKRIIMLERLEIATQFGAVAPVAASIEPDSSETGALDRQQAPVDSLKSCQADQTPTPGEADQGGTDRPEIPPSESEGQK